MLKVYFFAQYSRTALDLAIDLVAQPTNRLSSDVFRTEQGKALVDPVSDHGFYNSFHPIHARALVSGTITPNSAWHVISAETVFLAGKTR